MTHVLHQHPFTPFDHAPEGDVSHFRALPIPVDILPNEVGTQFRHRVGTRALETTQWLPSDEESEPTIEMKRELLRLRRDEVTGRRARQRRKEVGFTGRWPGHIPLPRILRLQQQHRHREQRRTGSHHAAQAPLDPWPGKAMQYKQPDDGHR